MPELFVNRLTVIDFSYLHSVRGLVGESWQVDIVLRGGLDHQGMVLDFGEVKKSVKQLIDEHFDHKLLVPAQYAGTLFDPSGFDLSGFDATGGQSRVTFTTRGGEVTEHSAPVQAIALIDTQEITPESLASAIIDTLRPHMPDNVAGIKIRLWPETSEGAYYHYSHGLKQHSGNCQRIAHGHRSRLRIERNGSRDTTLEQAWAERWRDIYIGTRADLLDQQPDRYHFGYSSEQGRFELTLPAERCYLIDTDSTVENIAQHLADTLKQEFPDDTFRVLAFEGVDKGAIGNS